MSETATTERTDANVEDKPVSERAAVAIARTRLPWNPAIGREFSDMNVSAVTWRTLVEAIWSEAKTTEAVAMALSYCRARNLDPFKRPVHIVPVYHRGLGRMVETVWPGISELRTTAARTGQYAGKDQVVYGPDITKKIGNADVTFPEWASLTVYRLVGGVRCAFEGDKVFWEETYAEKGGAAKDKSPNAMWSKRTRGQLGKCAEAQALRQAFPEEIGNQYAAEEMEGQVIGGAGGITDPQPAGNPVTLAGEAEPKDADFTDVGAQIERKVQEGAARPAPEKTAAGAAKASGRKAADRGVKRPTTETAEDDEKNGTSAAAGDSAGAGHQAEDDEDDTLSDEQIVAGVEADEKAAARADKGKAIQAAKGALARIAEHGEPALAARARKLLDRYED